MPYKVINDFRDKENNNIIYRKGDTYPVEGYKPSKKRITELSKEHPEHRLVFIEEVKETVKQINSEQDSNEDEQLNENKE
ncbi:hypothetical protein M3685_10670 [Heyndrickxia oleronia]|uniref:hypothetical protein n=1 Tax=Heyndrickxia oleronia TaxID=38875 RepID=UPI00203C2032|nr:hypothetical protein [Heyndrickxia oleronia]MCM3454407.1 hypothetical protein [Heyndrickxia oleronia]